MEIKELSEILKNKYKKAQKGEAVVSIHLFGIEYAEIINKKGYKVSQIIKFAEMKKSYSTELSKGIKHTKYVKLR